MTFVGIKQDFPVLLRQDAGVPLVYLDSASSSQCPTQVLDAITEYYHHHANVHRGQYTLAEEATALYEDARAKVARFIGAQSAEVIFCKNATEALNLAAYSLGRKVLNDGDIVVLTEMEHHSNLVPWLMLAQEKNLTLRHVKVDTDGNLILDDLDVLLSGAKVFAFTAASNVLGTLTPVAELAAAARRHGAVSVVDATQLVPHAPVDVVSLGADLLAFTGHKMLAPTGIGVLWGRQELLNLLPPFLGGGAMVLDVTLDGFVPNELPWKFEAGTPPIAQAVGLGAAIDYLSGLGMDTVQRTEQELTRYLIEQLHTLGGITVYGTASHRNGAVAFNVDGTHPHDVAQVLSDSNVCVRASNHCAKPLHKALGITATVRASLYVYNDTSDVDSLIRGLERTKGFFL